MLFGGVLYRLNRMVVKEMSVEFLVLERLFEQNG